MSEADKKRILERLTNMRGEILSTIGPREQRYEAETPPERPYVFLRQRMEKLEKPGGIVQEAMGCPELIWLLVAAVFRFIRLIWR